MHSRVYVKSKYSNNRTVCEDLYATSPYKVLTLNGDAELEIVLMSSSAGLLKGDSLDMSFDFAAESCQKISTQSYEKVFDCDGGLVTKNLEINVGLNSVVKYLPYPTILFKDSKFHNITTAKISSSSRFFYSDIFSCGRIHMGERFKLKEFSSILKVFIDGQLGFADNSYLCPEDYSYDKLGLWHNFTHNGLLYVYLPTSEECKIFIETARKEGNLLQDAEVGISMARKGLVVRVLANSGDVVFNYFKTLGKNV